MIKYAVSLIVLSSLATSVLAHQPELSTTMLVEQTKGKWLLQVRSALTAFQYEVETNYSKGAYRSPEEFQELVLEHLKKNIQLSFNEDSKYAIALEGGFVKLGHETNVIFELVGVPQEIKSLSITNNTFDGISRSQSAFIIAKNSFKRKQFILKEDNQHTVKLLVENNQFKQKRIKLDVQSIFSEYVYLINITVLLIFTLMFLINKGLSRQKRLLIE